MFLSVTIASVLNYLQFVAKEGETVEPGTKIAVISKSGEGVAHVAPSEKIPEKASPKPPPAEKVNEKQQPKLETTSAKEKPKAPSPPPPKRSATEPQLPPKERERRVSLLWFPIYSKYSFSKFISLISINF